MLPRGKIQANLHAEEELNNDDLAIEDLVAAIISPTAEVVEEYPFDRRTPACLIAGMIDDEEYIHAVVTTAEIPAVVTAYRVDKEEWIDYRTRRLK